MSMLTVLQTEEKALVLGGDGRCDSPGFSAKFGAYSFIELDHNVVLYNDTVTTVNTHGVSTIFFLSHP